MNTIQSLWSSYLRDAIPAEASAIQKQECKRAFYAGAAAMMNINHNVGHSNISEEAACAILEGVDNELLAFKNLIGKGE